MPPIQQQQQQQITATNSLPQHTAPWVVQVPRPTTVPNYKYRQSTFLSVVLIIVGTLSIVFNIVDLVVGTKYNIAATSLGFASHGFWSGLLCIIAGGCGLLAGRNRSLCSIRGFLALCIIAAFFCLAQFAIAVAGALLLDGYQNRELCCGDSRSTCGYSDYSTSTRPSSTGVCSAVQTLIAMESLLAMMGFIGGVAAIWGSALGCRTACCCSCYCCKDPFTQQFANVTQMAIPVITQEQGGKMISVMNPAQYPMQHPIPPPAGNYQLPVPSVPVDCPPSFYTPLVSSPHPPQPGVVATVAPVSVSLSSSTEPDYETCDC